MDQVPDRDTGKTCLGGGMHCPSASSYLFIDVYIYIFIYLFTYVSIYVFIYVFMYLFDILRQ